MINYRRCEPGTGKILIAEPFLADENFRRSVVLLTEYAEEGVVGFVLNRPLHVRVSELVSPDLEWEHLGAEAYLGGPVGEDHLHFLHRMPELEEARPVSDELYWGGSLEHMAELIRSGKMDEKDVRFFVGYAGWDREQLEQEMNNKSWIVSDFDSSWLFEPLAGNEYWKSMLRKLGSEYVALAEYPMDAHWN